MIGAGGKLLILSAVVIGGGLIARQIFAEEAIRSDRVIEMDVEPVNFGSPFEWEFLVTYKNKTNQEIIFTGIMQARDCETAALGLQTQNIVLGPKEEKQLSYIFTFDPADVVGCSKTMVDFFSWISFADPTPLAKRKTVTISF